MESGDTGCGQGYLPPPLWGETAFSIFPPGSGKWGEKTLFSPQGPKYGGGNLQIFSAPAAGWLKNLGLQGFVVVSSDKLPYSRRFPPTYTLLACAQTFCGT